MNNIVVRRDTEDTGSGGRSKGHLLLGFEIWPCTSQRTPPGALESFHSIKIVPMMHRQLRVVMFALAKDKDYTSCRRLRWLSTCRSLCQLLCDMCCHETRKKNFRLAPLASALRLLGWPSENNNLGETCPARFKQKNSVFSIAYGTAILVGRAPLIPHVMQVHVMSCHVMQFRVMPIVVCLPQHIMPLRHSISNLSPRSPDRQYHTFA